MIHPMGDRVLGRIALEDIIDPADDAVVVAAGEEITEEHIDRIDSSAIEKIMVRSVLTCRTPRGVCVKCYGRDLSRGNLVNLGEAVGIIAAQSIGEPGTQLTMRTFHLGGTASRAVEQSVHTSRYDGNIKLEGIQFVENKDGKLVVLNRTGQVIITDDNGRERESFKLVYGTILNVKEGDKIDKGFKLAEWDPYSNPIVADVTGTVKFDGIVEGVTVNEQVDPVTGFATKVITEGKSADGNKPTVYIMGPDGEPLRLPGRDIPARYVVPVGAQLMVADGAEIHSGDIVAKIHRETSKTKDITGGLPRVAELFEARTPKEAAIVSEIDGYVTFGKDVKGKQRVIVTPDVGEQMEYLIPKGKHVAVREGEYVKAGESLMDGPTNPHDILKVLGEKELAAYLVDEIQEVYRLQGVAINDKHIENIVRQMLRKVTVLDTGDTRLLAGEQVEKYVFEEENERVAKEGGQLATFEPLLLGITKVSLSTDSWISAASFQETTKVLTNAAVHSKTDSLIGLKENIIMGRLVPAGTGLATYKNLGIQVDDLEEEPMSSLPGMESAVQTTQA